MADLVVNDIQSPNVVSGWNIFWAILTLSLSCITHPVGSSCGFPRIFKHTVRINPFLTLLDSAHLLHEVLLCRAADQLGWRAAIHHAIVDRLKDSDPGVVRDKDLKVLSTGRHEIRVRSLVAALCVIQYAKVYGCHGTPIFFSASTMLFVSWAVMEATFCYAYFYDQTTPHRPSISSAPRSSKLSLRAGVWSYILLATAMLATSRIPIAGILDAALDLTRRSIIVWHTGVVWLPMTAVGWAPDAFRDFPNPDARWITTLFMLYVMIVAFLVLAALYWVLAIAGVGLVVLPLYFGIRVSLPVVLRVARAVGKRARGLERHRNSMRVGNGLVVAAGVVYLVMVYDPEGTWKDRWAGAWVQWLP